MVIMMSFPSFRLCAFFAPRRIFICNNSSDPSCAIVRSCRMTARDRRTKVLTVSRSLATQESLGSDVLRRVHRTRDDGAFARRTTGPIDFVLAFAL